ncbi:MAG: DUF2878 domain-containing protein [Parachlamydiaceae bacterium]|nr:DUF2878 domain-containing protein [Parachlamydiaceae bacterium]
METLFFSIGKDKILSFLRWFFNALFFYIGWLVCMYEAVGKYPLIGPLVVGGILIYHFIVTNEKKSDLIICLALAFLGTIVDSVYVAIGMLEYQGGFEYFPNIAPLWITSLWVLYGTSVNHSLKWMRCSVFVAAAMGAGGAISSYLAGLKLEAVNFLWEEWLVLTVIGTVWAIVVPLSLYFGFLLRKKEQGVGVTKKA